MYVERLLQVNTVTLAALGTLLLGMGQRTAVLPVVVLIAAITSLWLTDVTGRFQLNRTAAAVAAVLAVSLACWDLVPWGSALVILVIAKALIYLQIVLLFQAKDARIYGQLLTLSLLQVVVATIFNQGFWFGVLLVVYLFGAFSALALLFLYREGNRFAGDVPPPHPARAADEQAFQEASGGGTATGHHGVGGELYRRLAMMGLATLVLAGVAFFTMPRLGRPAWRSSIVAPRHLVGYSQKVELGELGEIIEDPHEVMRVRFIDPATDDIYPVRGDIYLHGAVLTHYVIRRWACGGSWIGGRDARLSVAVDPPRRGVVLQEITIEPMDSRELFCVRPFFVTRRRPDLRFDHRRRRLLRMEQDCVKRYSFSLKTTALAGGVQAELVPAEPFVSREHLLQLPRADSPAALGKMTALANRWAAEASASADDPVAMARCPVAMARYLEHRLRDSGDFQYSLKRQPRDYSIDPIEDFVSNNPRGHCEYFATTLAMMLRTQGIPSRLVVGYKCDEWNNLGRFYQVRQLHAHTWVEAYLRPEEIPPEMVGARHHEDWSHGAWLRLDPTAGTSDEGGPARSLFAPLKQAVNYIESLWDNYVMEMDRSRQYEAIYQPLVRMVRNAVRRLADPQWWRGLWEKLVAALNVRNWSVGQWFSWRGGLTAMVVSLLVYIGYRGCRWLWRLVRGWFSGRRASREARDRIEVEFYRRLRAVLARHGLIRSDTETHREFALAAGAAIAESTGRARLAPLPVQVVEAFYRVRFGRLPLDTSRAEAVEQALAELEETAARGFAP